LAVWRSNGTQVEPSWPVSGPFVGSACVLIGRIRRLRVGASLRYRACSRRSVPRVPAQHPLV
jgi:hypothetical protein